MSRRLCRPLLALALMALPAAAADQCDAPTDDQFLGAFLSEYETCIEQMRTELDEAGGTSHLESAAAKEVHETLAAKPSGTTGFGSQLRDSIEDFLPLFGFAVDSVSTSDDDKSLVLRLNPLRSARFGSLAVTVTATEPEPGDELLMQAPEGQKTMLEELAAEDLDDLANLTYGFKWGIERQADLDASRPLFGRSYQRYRPFIEKRLLPAVAADADLSGIEQRLTDLHCDPDSGETIEAMKARLKDRFELCLDLLRRRRTGIVALDRRLDKLSLLPFLIDNQPQLVVSGAFHDRDPIVGRDGWEVELSYEMGFDNFNSILKRYDKLRRDRGLDADPSALNQAFWDAVEGLDETQVKAENKFTFSLAYAERRPYRFDRTFGSGDDAIPVQIDLAGASDVCGKVEWHRNATWHEIEVGDMTVSPRLHVSGEYVDVSDDPLRQDRMVWVATYEIPLAKGTSLPLSLTYANHAEFLGEPDKELSAHFGVSYKLPTGGGE